MQALCDTFAHYGYVTASIEYRKNFNLLSSGSAERAVWRGIQDASAAVRFLKIIVRFTALIRLKYFWGSSAGAFMALGLAYIDDAERFSSIFLLQPLVAKTAQEIITPFLPGGRDHFMLGSKPKTVHGYKTTTMFPPSFSMEPMTVPCLLPKAIRLVCPPHLMSADHSN